MEKRFHMKTHMQMHFHLNVCVCAYVNVLFEMDFSRQNKSQKKTTQEELDNQFSVRHPIPSHPTTNICNHDQPHHQPSPSKKNLVRAIVMNFKVGKSHTQKLTGQTRKA